MYAAALHVVAAMAYAVEALDDQSAQTPSLWHSGASPSRGARQPQRDSIPPSFGCWQPFFASADQA